MPAVFFILISIFLLGSIATPARAQIAAPISVQGDDQHFEKPLPDYPQSEYSKGREGWVLVRLTVGRSGLVENVEFLESSGNDIFDQVTLDTLQSWRFTPGEERKETALVNFAYDETVVQLSRRFMSLNARLHAQIEKGRLEKAEELLADIRSDDDLSVFELAYSYLSEGRIAGARGDAARQLELFRKAVRNNGRWLARENYLASLRALVILEIDQQDYPSAVRDYDLLIETPTGKALAEDLTNVIEIIRAQMEEHDFQWQPFIVADNQVTVERDRPRLDNSLSRPPSDPRGTVKPSAPSAPPPNRR